MLLLTENQYIERLYKEWIEHGKIVVGVDFDDTTSPWKIANQEQCDWVIGCLKKVVYTGAYIVIHTSCNPDRYEEIRRYFDSKGLKIDSINQNPIDLPYGNGDRAKPQCNIYLDDRAGLEQALNILMAAMYRKRADNFKNNITEQNAE